jgi:hypothetical protein
LPIAGLHNAANAMAALAVRGHRPDAGFAFAGAARIPRLAAPRREDRRDRRRRLVRRFERHQCRCDRGGDHVSAATAARPPLPGEVGGGRFSALHGTARSCNLARTAAGGFACWRLPTLLAFAVLSGP